MRKILFLICCIFLLSACSPSANQTEQPSPSSSKQSTAPTHKPTIKPTNGPSTSPSLATITPKPNTPNNTQVIQAALCRTDIKSDEYQRAVQGANSFVSWAKEQGININLTLLDGKGDESNLQNDITSFIDTYGNNAILAVYSSNGKLISRTAEIAENNGVYWSSYGVPSTNHYPMNYAYYVAHQKPDYATGGYKMACALFHDFKEPDKGNILVLRTKNVDPRAEELEYGLSLALEQYEDVKIVESRYSSVKGTTDTVTKWLKKYDDIDAIWCANDSLALKVAESLRNHGRLKIAVSGVGGTDKAIAEMPLISNTIWNDSALQTGNTFASALMAKTGELSIPLLSAEERFYSVDVQLVTPDNYEDSRKTPTNPDFSKWRECISSPLV